MSRYTDRSGYWYGERSSRGHPHEERGHNYRVDSYQADTRYTERRHTDPQYRDPYDSNRGAASYRGSDRSSRSNRADRHEGNTGRFWRDRRTSGPTNMGKREFTSDSQYSRDSRAGRGRLSYDHDRETQRAGYYKPERDSQRRHFRNPGTERSRSYDSYERDSDQYSHHYPVSVDHGAHYPSDRGYRQKEKISIDYQHKSCVQDDQAPTYDESIYRPDETSNGDLGQSAADQNYKTPEFTHTHFKNTEMLHEIDKEHDTNRNLTESTFTRPNLSSEDTKVGNMGESHIDLTSENPNHSGRLSSVFQNTYASQTEVNNDNKAIDVNICHVEGDNFQHDNSIIDRNLPNVENQASAQLQETMMNINNILSKLQTKLKPSVSEGEKQVNTENKHNVDISSQSHISSISVEEKVGEQVVESAQTFTSGNQVTGTNVTDLSCNFDDTPDFYDGIKIPGIMSPGQDYEDEDKSTEHKAGKPEVFHKITEDKAGKPEIFHERKTFYDEAENLNQWSKKQWDTKEGRRSGDRTQVRDERPGYDGRFYQRQDYRERQNYGSNHYGSAVKFNSRGPSVRQIDERQPQNHQLKDRKLPKQTVMERSKQNGRQVHQHDVFKHVERDKRDFQRGRFKEENKNKDTLCQKTLLAADKDVELRRKDQTSTDKKCSSTETSVSLNISVPSQDGKGTVHKRSLKGFKIPKLRTSCDGFQTESKSNEVTPKSGLGKAPPVKDSTTSSETREIRSKKHTDSNNTQPNIFEKLNLEISPAKINESKKKMTIPSETVPHKNVQESNCEDSNSSVDSNCSGIFGKLEQFLSKDKYASKAENKSVSADQKLSNTQDDKKSKNQKEIYSQSKHHSTSSHKDGNTTSSNKYDLESSDGGKVKANIKDLNSEKGQFVWKDITLLYPKIQLKKLTTADIEDLRSRITKEDPCDRELAENEIGDIEDGVYMEIGSDDDTQVLSPDLEIIEDDIAVAIAESIEDDWTEIGGDLDIDKTTEIEIKKEVISEDELKNPYVLAQEKTVKYYGDKHHNAHLDDTTNQLHAQNPGNNNNFQSMALNCNSKTEAGGVEKDSNKPTCSVNLAIRDNDDNDNDSGEESQSILETVCQRQIPDATNFNDDKRNCEESPTISKLLACGDGSFSDHDTINNNKPLTPNTEKIRRQEISDEDDLPIIKRPKTVPRTRVIPRKSSGEMIGSTFAATTEKSTIVPVRKKIFKSNKTTSLKVKNEPRIEADVEDNIFDEPTQKYDYSGEQTLNESDIHNANDNDIQQNKENQSDGIDLAKKFATTNIPKTELSLTEPGSEKNTHKVKEEPSWLKNGYTQEPDTIFISDDDDDLALNASQPIISLDSSDSEHGNGREHVKSIKREKGELETIDIDDPDYWLCSSPDDNSGKESDFDQEDFYEMVSRLSEPNDIDKDEKNEGNVSDNDIYHFSDSNDSFFDAKDDIKEKTHKNLDDQSTQPFQNNRAQNKEASDLENEHDCKAGTTKSGETLNSKTQIMENMSVYMQDTQVDADTRDNDSDQISALEYQSEFFSDDSSSLLSKDCEQKSGISSKTEQQDISIGKPNSPRIIIEDLDDDETFDSMSEYSDESDFGDLSDLATQKYDINEHCIYETKTKENHCKDLDGSFQLDEPDSEIKKVNKPVTADNDEEAHESKTRDNPEDYLLLTQVNDDLEQLSISKKTERDLKVGHKSESKTVTSSDKQLTDYSTATQVDENIKRDTEGRHKAGSSKEGTDIQTLDGRSAVERCYQAQTQLDRDLLDLTGEEEYETDQFGFGVAENSETQNYEISVSEQNDYIIETQVDNHDKISSGYEVGTQAINKSSESHVERSAKCLQQNLQEDDKPYEDPQYELYLQRYISPSKLKDKLGIKFDHSFYADQPKIKFLDDDLYINKTKSHQDELSPYLVETQQAEKTSNVTRKDHQLDAYMNETQVDDGTGGITANLPDADEAEDELLDPYLSLTQVDESSRDDFLQKSQAGEIKGQVYHIMTQIDDTEIEIQDSSPNFNLHGKHSSGARLKLKSLSKTMNTGSKTTTSSSLGKRPHPSSTEGNTGDESDTHTKPGMTSSETVERTPAKKTKLDVQDEQENSGPPKMPCRSDRQSIIIEPLPMNSRINKISDHAVPPARSQSFLNARKSDSFKKQVKDDTWLSKKTTADKSKTKPTERKRNKSSDTPSSIKAGISEAKSRLEERNMKYITNPGCVADPSKRSKHSSSVTSTDQNKDVDYPTLSQVISKGYPILDEGILHRKKQNTTSGVSSAVRTSTTINTVSMTTTSVTTSLSNNIPSQSAVSVTSSTSKVSSNSSPKVQSGKEKSSRETHRDKEKSSHHRGDEHRSSSSKHKSSHHKSDRDKKHDDKSKNKHNKSDESKKDRNLSRKDKHESGEKGESHKRDLASSDKSHHHKNDKKERDKSDSKGKLINTHISGTHKGDVKGTEHSASSSKLTVTTSKQSEDKQNKKVQEKSAIYKNVVSVTNIMEGSGCVNSINKNTKQTLVSSSEKSPQYKSDSRNSLPSGSALNNNLHSNSGHKQPLQDINRKKTTADSAEPSKLSPASVGTSTSRTVEKSNHKIPPNMHKNTMSGNVQRKKVTWCDNSVSNRGPSLNNPGPSQNNRNRLDLPSSLAAESLMKKIPLGPSVVPPALPHQSEPLPPDLLKIKKAVTWENILPIILKWKSTWFEERDKMEMSGLKKCPPPNVIEEFGKQDENELLPLVERYTSLEEYVHKFMLPLLMHETWQSLYSDWREKKMRGHLYSLKVFLNNQESFRKNLQEYTFIGLMSREERKQWSSLGKGDLITLKLYENLNGQQMSNENVLKEILGVVDSVSYKDSNVVVERMCHQNPEFAQLRRPDSTQIVLTVRVRKRNLNPSNTPLPEIQPVSSILTTERQINALSCFGNSPMCRDLLHPTTNSTYCDRALPSSSNDRKKLNESQSMAVNSAVRIVSHVSNPTPRICIIQGPPGTGKSYTIINIIYRIVKENKGKCHICLTAPSHAAVDELVRKIHRMNHETANKSNKVKLVRLGKKHSIHPDVQGYAVDILVHKRLRETLLEKAGDVPQSLQAERRALETKISTLHSNIKASKDMYQVQKWNNDLKRHLKDKENLESKFHVDKNQIHPGMEKRAKYEILNGAHVIAGTLSSMGSALLKQYLPKNNMFDCVIIDEATQAIELDTLIPLQYGASKLILVGDPEQLCPTVLSQDAQKNKLNMSLFQRLDSYFRYNTSPQRNPVIFLDTQYRMDKEIAKFPNSYIYEGKLKSYTEHSKSSLVPYLLFDIREGEEQFSQGSRSMSNHLEAMFTAELCKFILKETKFVETSIGIIAPYSKQRDEVLRELRARGMKSIEVSTVDGFQGREKHIVIMSCVRAVSGSLGFVGNRNRMNVALTRAKYAMYLVGHFGALQSSDEWKALIADARDRDKITSVSINTYTEDIRSCLIKHVPTLKRSEMEMEVDAD